MNETLSRWTPVMLSVLRFVAGLVLLQHGLQKLIGVPPLGGSLHPLLVPIAGQAALPPILVAACLIETIGGVLLVAGLFTRSAAFIVSGQMAVIYWAFDVPSGGLIPVLNHGELAVMLCFVFLYIVFAGGGAWSLDAWMGRTATKTPGANTPRIGSGA